MSGQTINQAVAAQAKRGVIDRYRQDFAEVLPSHIKADQWVRLTQGVIRKNEKLQFILDNNPRSVLAALLDCARLGLEPGETYHLVPFGGEVVGIPDYTGLIELMHRAGAVRAVKTEIVYEADLTPDPDDVDPRTGKARPRFLWEPSYMDRPHHRPDWFGARGKMMGVYAYAVLLDGSTSQVIMRNAVEIEKVRSVSKSAKKPGGPWDEWPDRMWKKTVIRELSKFVPTSAEFRATSTAPEGPAETLPWTATRAPFGDQDYVDGEVITDEPAAEPANSD